jgi:2-polyprenyl-3-methyl-5-hydroxy-6-metoxy-1,4-benzoquinol methylase
LQKWPVLNSHNSKSEAPQEIYAPRNSCPKKFMIRQKIEEIVAGGVEDICDYIEFYAKDLVIEDLARQEEILKQVKKITDLFRLTKNLQYASTMLRYFIEGLHDSYFSNPAPTLDFLKRKGHMKGDQILLDLGSGRGDLVSSWNEAGQKSYGIDLSPSFVAKNKNLMLGLIDGEFADLQQVLGKDFSAQIIVSNLTLDRVSQPKRLLQNISKLASLCKANFLISTILPIKAFDDDAIIKNQIHYTKQSNLLTKGFDADEDHHLIMSYLKDLNPHMKLESGTMSYHVNSYSGLKDYSKYYFYASGE